MSRVLNSSTTVNFSDPQSEGLEIRLEQDTTRPMPSKVFPSPMYHVTAQDKTSVKMFHGPNVNPQVEAITGSIVYLESGIDKRVVDVAVVTPENPEVKVPSWAIDVSFRVVGKVYGQNGGSAATSLTYNQSRGVVVSSHPVHAAVEIVYDAPYKRYTYTFDGFCPATPPNAFDNRGNFVEHVAPNNFTDGVVFAIDFNKNAYASLVMDGPECSWGGGSVRGTETMRSVPRIAMDIHPAYPPRLIASTDGRRVWCECTVRIFPAGAGTTVYTTSGKASGTNTKGTLPVKDVLIFENESSKSLSYTPTGSVSLTPLTIYPVNDRFRPFVNREAVSVVAPLGSITDAELVSGGYRNPTSRNLATDEVAIVDIYRVPCPVLAVVEAEYATSFDCFVFEFDWDGAREEWKEAILLARTADNRTATLEVSPPTTKARNRKFADE